MTRLKWQMCDKLGPQTLTKVEEVTLLLLFVMKSSLQNIIRKIEVSLQKLFEPVSPRIGCAGHGSSPQTEE